jgi:mxaL protein
MKPLEVLRRSWRDDRDRWLLGAAALALAAGFLKPSLPLQRELFDHVVVLDVTQSMNVQDQLLEGKPASRLAYAKHALRHALLRLPCGSKVGLGLFTEYRSYLLLTPVEVCANLQELRSTLAQIDGRMAWTGNSEITKGLFSGLTIARQLPDAPSLVFVTDGHEAPPLDPRRRPVFNGKPGEVPGLIVGVGGLTPLPIPKIDTLGRPLGYWSADEVMQADPRGASGNSSSNSSEHLSSLHEAHLRLLSSETGLRFLRLQDTQALVQALTAQALARPVPARLDLRGGLAAIALGLLVLRHWRWPLFTRRSHARARSALRQL